MKEYIRIRIRAVTSEMPTDTKMTILQDIYSELEERGYSARQAKEMIDAVIYDNIFCLKTQLNQKLCVIRESYRELKAAV